MSFRRSISSITRGLATVIGVGSLLAAVMVASSVTASADNGPHGGVYTVTNRDGNQEQFTIGGDNGCTVYHRWASSGGVTPSGGWSSMGGCVFAGHGLDVGMNPSGRLEVFAIGTDHAVWHEWQTVAGSGPWSDWASLGGYSTSGPSVVSWWNSYNRTQNGGLLGLSVTGGDGATWNKHQTQQNCCWTAWNKVS